MKKITLLLFLIFAICHAQAILTTPSFNIIYKNDNTLLVLNKSDNKVLYKVENIYGSSFEKNLFVSKDQSKLWYQNSFDYICVNTSTWKVEKKINGFNVFLFCPTTNREYFVHSQLEDDEFTSSIYDANKGEIIKTVKYNAHSFVDDVIYDSKTGYLYQLSSNYVSSTETKQNIKDFPENVDDITNIMKNDGNETELIVYDVRNDKLISKKSNFYSASSSPNLEIINDKVYIITGIGTALIDANFNFKIAPMIYSGLRSYAIVDNGIIGVTFFEMFNMNFSTWESKSLDVEIHEDILNADAFCSTNGIDIYVLRNNKLSSFSLRNLSIPTSSIDVP